MLGWSLGGLAAVSGAWASLRLGAEGDPEAGSWWRSKEDVARAKALTRNAALSAFADLAQAQRLLDEALRADPSHVPARLVRACCHMQHAQWESARDALAHPQLRETLEAQLLLDLTTRRPQAPDWHHAFLASWQALGKPDFHTSPLLPEPFAFNLVLIDALPSGDRVAPELCLPLTILNPPLVEFHRQEVLGQVRASDSICLLVALREQLLALAETHPSRGLLFPEVESRLARLSASAPRTLQLALLSFLGDVSASTPFTHQDLEALEAFVDLPDWKQTSNDSLFQEMRALFTEALDAPGHHAWLVASSAQGLHLAQVLLGRAGVSRPHLIEDDRRWMGKLLWEVGARLRAQPSHRELDMGLRLQILGSELTGHSDTRTECLSAWVELGHWEKAAQQAAYERWPLATLQEESCAARAHQEHAWLRAFASPPP